MALSGVMLPSFSTFSNQREKTWETVSFLLICFIFCFQDVGYAWQFCAVNVLSKTRENVKEILTLQQSQDSFCVTILSGVESRYGQACLHRLFHGWTGTKPGQSRQGRRGSEWLFRSGFYLGQHSRLRQRGGICGHRWPRHVRAGKHGAILRSWQPPSLPTAPVRRQPHDRAAPQRRQQQLWHYAPQRCPGEILRQLSAFPPPGQYQGGATHGRLRSRFGYGAPKLRQNQARGKRFVHDVLRATTGGHLTAGSQQHDPTSQSRWPGSLRLPGQPVPAHELYAEVSHTGSVLAPSSGSPDADAVPRPASCFWHVRRRSEPAARRAEGDAHAALVSAGAPRVETEKGTTHMAAEAHSHARLQLRRLRKNLYQKLPPEGTSPHAHR